MNLAYKHLNSKPKIGELTPGQWAVAFLGVVLMLTWGFYLSPLSPYLSIITAVYLGGLPVALALLASYAEFNVWRFARCAWSWTVAGGCYAPGPGPRTCGYRISSEHRADAGRERGRSSFDPEALWG